jgi:hypothetical protein
MGKVKISELSQEDIDRLRADAERLGIRTYQHVPLQPQPVGRGNTARAIRGRQLHIAKRSGVEIIREERDAL